MVIHRSHVKCDVRGIRKWLDSPAARIWFALVIHLTGMRISASIESVQSRMKVFVLGATVLPFLDLYYRVCMVTVALAVSVESAMRVPYRWGWSRLELRSNRSASTNQAGAFVAKYPRVIGTTPGSVTAVKKSSQSSEAGRSRSEVSVSESAGRNP